MDIRAQASMVFHLDKCIGCHTCSVACKNIWTDRPGAEYMWWNNVETKPGTGYPTLWEDQEKYRGGWEKRDGKLTLKLQNRPAAVANIFFNPRLPGMDEYYEPWTYRYGDLFTSPPGENQPAARPVSLVTGKPVDIEAGPNWDDDLGGSPLYAKNDPNLKGVSENEQRLLHEVERNVYFYIPRICNHCLNPGCVAACPAGAADERAIYKRGEDGIVLINPEKCRAWRMCVSGCPYKKVYYNWSTGKSEKCILCYPRQETGQVPACFHVCVGRIRYLGFLLYDAERIQEAASAPDAGLVEAQRAAIQDPFDPSVVAAARAGGLSDAAIQAARNSPVYRFVKQWKIALPLTPQFRTLPMLFYVPPLLPVLGTVKDGLYDIPGSTDADPVPLLASLEQARLPLAYMASLFTAGNAQVIADVYRKLIAVRAFTRARHQAAVTESQVAEALSRGATTAEEATAIFNLTSRATYEEHFVVPPFAREVRIEATEDPGAHRQDTGFGFRKGLTRRG
jgi:nitrate reductase / nitrite oxidoreductase, beta subunit